MSIDYIIGPRNPNAPYERVKMLDWLKSRDGYEIHGGVQAERDRETNYVMFDFLEEPEIEEELDPERPIFVEASTGSGGSLAEYMENIAEMRAFCEAFDLLVCDPQSDIYAFGEPSVVLGG